MLWQFTHLGIVDDLLDFFFVVSNFREHLVENLLFGNNILDTHSKTSVNKPIVYDQLDVRNKVTASLRSQILPYNVNKTTLSCTNNLVLHYSSQVLALLNNHSLIFRTHPLITILKVDALWDDHAENLFASPERFRLYDSGLGQSKVKVVVNPHQNIHSSRLVKETVTICKSADAKQRILLNAHARLVALRCNNLSWYSHNFLNFSFCLE